MQQLNSAAAHLAAAQILAEIPDLQLVIGIILGSGLGNFVTQLEEARYFSYEKLPGFPKITVLGHGGNLVLGKIGGISVACLQGRVHLYEDYDYTAMKNYIRTLRLLGCEYFLATNASGSLRKEIGPGKLVLIKDHINMQPGNPLVGPNDEEFGPRFLSMENLYDREISKRFLQIARKEGVQLAEGVYLAVIGPTYETAAEIKAFRILGADLVGMSTVPEVIIARHCGMRVGAIATVTNYATGLVGANHDHNEVLAVAAKATGDLMVIVKRFIAELESTIV